MPSISYEEVKKSASDCIIDSKVVEQFDISDIRVDDHGDKFAEAIMEPSKGYYAKLAKLYADGADVCAKALKNKKIDVQSIKKVLKDAKKQCVAQSKYCEEHRHQFELQYQLTQEIFNELEKNV